MARRWIHKSRGGKQRSRLVRQSCRRARARLADTGNWELLDDLQRPSRSRAKNKVPYGKHRNARQGNGRVTVTAPDPITGELIRHN